MSIFVSRHHPISEFRRAFTDRLKLLWSLNWLAQAACLSSKRFKGRIYVGRGGVVEVHKSGRIDVVNGSLFVNRKWFARDPFSSYLYVGARAVLLVRDSFLIYSGARVYVEEGARLVLSGGYMNHGCKIYCYQSIEIGYGVAIADNVVIRDSDNKNLTFCDSKVVRNPSAPIWIGDHVWIGMNVTILKGVRIGEGAVVAAGSLVITDVPERALVAGSPARVIRESVTWY